MNARVVIDGRVFATEAADRGMGRYVRHLCACFEEAGCDVSFIIPKADVVAEALPRGRRTKAMVFDRDPVQWTSALNRVLAQHRADLYVDATPFLPPDRYDIYPCPVVAVLYDVIPLRYPRHYFESLGSPGFTEYINGLARVQKADQVIAISEYVKGHALRYLGVAGERCTVVPPDVDDAYRDFPVQVGWQRAKPGGGVTCIQGAHRSKNFPSAIRFLERLMQVSGTKVHIIVPTAGQRERIEAAREDRSSAVRVSHALGEAQKFELQRDADAIAHLSLDEGYGIPLAEALYLYRPIICIDNAINRELICGEDPASAGILLIRDPSLADDDDVHAAAAFVRDGPQMDFAARGRIIARLEARQRQAHVDIAGALTKAKDHFDAWHSGVGLALAAPTEFGSCGVSDYCLALARMSASRYVLLLGPAPRELQLRRHLRLLPIALLDELRERIPGVLFNLAISPSLSLAFDAIAERSAPGDLLIVHDAGSYLPGLLSLAAMTGDRNNVFKRWLRGESHELHRLSRQWLDGASRSREDTLALYLQLDRMFRSLWLRGFRGDVISHHPAFERPEAPESKRVLAILPEESELRARTRFVPMPIDVRATPGLVRLARKMRWALGIPRDCLLVCCAGSIVQGKGLDVVARVIARLDDASRSTATSPITLLLAGRVIDQRLLSTLREEFTARGLDERLVHVVEPNETRYEALLIASDVVVAFREQRYIQMSHSYVRALALGRPIITNEGAGFDDQDIASVCRDDRLAEDLERHLVRLRDGESDRILLTRSSQARFRARHTVGSFFARVKKATHDASLL